MELNALPVPNCPMKLMHVQVIINIIYAATAEHTILMELVIIRIAKFVGEVFIFILVKIMTMMVVAVEFVQQLIIAQATL